MTHLSLFSGIGGLDLAAESAGFQTVGFVERDPFCQRVLAKHWPGVPIYDDVTTFDGVPFRGRVAVLSGGFPCQDVSAAGKQAGIHGGRSGLFTQLIRIVREVRPKFAVLENVAGLISGGGIAEVLGAISEIGFDAVWGIVPASAVGAPHKRERVFIVAYPGGVRRVASKIFGIKFQKSTSEWGQRNFARGRISGRSWVAPPPKCFGMDDGVSDWVDRVKALGNAVVPAQAAPIFAAIAKEILK